MRVMIAAAKRAIAKISSIILWPLTMLAKSVAKANRRMIRWAVGRRVGAVYMVAIFWFPTLTVAGATLALFSVHQKPDEAWPIVGAALLIVKKVMALAYYLLEQGFRTIKALRHYRRHFRSGS
jgi:hypothetical protein